MTTRGGAILLLLGIVILSIAAVVVAVASSPSIDIDLNLLASVVQRQAAIAAGRHASSDTDAPAAKCYGMEMDAGSSGTRIYVYSWTCRDKQEVPDFNFSQEVPNLSVKPGIASFSTNISGIAAYLAPLLNYAKGIVPAEQQSTAPIFLRATAGMRLLSAADQDAVLTATRAALRTSGFSFEDDSWARIISGQEEGVFGWLAVNYLSNKTSASVSPANTIAVVDLGGASAQFTFVPPTAPAANSFSVNLVDVNTYNLYSYSYLGYGNDQARIAAINLAPTSGGMIYFPCFNTGYNATTSNGTTIVGTGNATECSDLIKRLFNQSYCTQGSCSFNNVYQPSLAGINMQFQGINGYVIMAQFLNLSTGVTPAEFKEAASELCETPFSKVQADHPGDSYVSTNCFFSLYASELLLTGFGVAADTPIILVNKIRGVSPTWAVGSILYDVALLPCKLNTEACDQSSGAAAHFGVSSSTITTSLLLMLVMMMMMMIVALLA